MNLEGLKDKNITLIVWNADKENDVHIYLGKLLSDNGGVFFLNEERGWKLSLSEDQLSSLRPVSDDLKVTLLNADYALSMSMSGLPGNQDTNDLTPTGMQWHD